MNTEPISVTYKGKMTETMRLTHQEAMKINATVESLIRELNKGIPGYIYRECHEGVFYWILKTDDFNNETLGREFRVLFLFGEKNGELYPVSKEINFLQIGKTLDTLRSELEKAEQLHTTTSCMVFYQNRYGPLHMPPGAEPLLKKRFRKAQIIREEFEGESKVAQIVFGYPTKWWEFWKRY